MQLQPRDPETRKADEDVGAPKPGRPALALVTFIPLLVLLAITMTAGLEKTFHPDSRIGFLASAHELDSKLPVLKTALDTAKANGTAAEVKSAEKAIHTNRILHFNWLLDAGVTLTFLVMVVLILVLSVREWLLLLARKKLATLFETPPTWLPDYAIVEAKPLHLLSLIGLALALAKELSGEAAVERESHQHACICAEHSKNTASNPYVKAMEERFKRINRCC